MFVKKNNDLGYIEYSDEVLANIAGIATMECYGVVGMALKRASDGLWELLKKESLSKGVKIVHDKEKVSAEIYIIVGYGTKISVIGSNIIQKVKYLIKNLTGIELSNVTVYVQGVRV